MFLCTTKTTTGMCFTCCEENIPIIICKQSKCDYAMCKKCYKKYYSKNDKCPACRNINNNNTYHIFKKMSHNLYECFLILTEFAPFTIIIISFFLIIAILFLLGRLLFFLFFSLVTKTTIASIIKYYWTTDIALFAISSIDDAATNVVMVLVGVWIVRNMLNRGNKCREITIKG